MGMCDPKTVRAGTPWYLAVNKIPLPPHPQTVLLAQAWRRKINDLPPKPKPLE